MTHLPHPEYPRPDLDRSQQWVSLNGDWQLASVDGTSTIAVPFAWETRASGIARTWLEQATYSRTQDVPADWTGRRIVLCFGAVHHHAAVTVDGIVVGAHSGGYEPFEFDITHIAAPGASIDLVVAVSAPADKRSIPHGKQRSIPRDDYDGVSFTPTSGIWQSVWLEARGRTFASHVAVRGDSLIGFDIRGALTGDSPATATVTVTASRGSMVRERVALVVDVDGTFAGRLDLKAPRLWSPHDPHLYALTIDVTEPDAGEAEADHVTVTAGLRRVETSSDGLYLNGERIYVRGVLDQGYWPDSGLTPPDDAALVRDLELARSLGYNLVRKHIKLESPRWLHHADRLGMLVWAEPPAHSRYTRAAAAAFEAQIEPMVRRDGNHPSIVIWGLYNEEWGLDWDIPGSPERAHAATRAYDLLHDLDDTRPIVENSGWTHVRTDIVDWHYYDDDPAAWAKTIAALADGTGENFTVRLGPDFAVTKSLYGSHDAPRDDLPMLNSEYGGGFTSLERAWHLRWQTQELRRHDRLSGYVYTELTDVEHEMAGIVDADRRPKDLGGLRAADVNTETVIVVNLIPAAAGADMPMPHEPITLHLHVSHHGKAPIEGRIRAAWTPAGAPLTTAPITAAAESAPVKADPFLLSAATRLTITAPEAGTSAARLALWLVDEDDTTRGCTFVDAGPIEHPDHR